MITDYFSCDYCGCVIDITVLKELEKDNTREGDYLYRDYVEFEKIKCPACKRMNQR
jgi:hypothetical protein